MNDRWERLIDLYHSAVMLPADERATLLAEECGDDSALQADIERMITAHHRVSRPTGVSPVIDVTKPPEPFRPLGAASSQPTTHRPITTDGEGQATGGVTESLDGQSIDIYADERQLSVTERLELFLLVCSAITNARRRGVAYGELTSETIHVSALGTPKLPDAGLGDDVATAGTDVSSLGVVLDRLLGTGVSVVGARRPLRRELDTIVLKAVRRDGEFRYESLDALTDDIQRYLDAPPAHERRDAKRGARPAKLVSRRVGPIVAWAVAAAAVIALGILAAPLLDRQAAAVAPAAPRVDAPATRTRVLVGDLVDRVGDPALAAALSDALRTGLSESPMVAVGSLRSRNDGELTGSIEPAPGGGYTIAVQLTFRLKPDESTALEETAADSAALIPALSRLSTRIREHMGESATSIAALPRLEDVTTTSLAALRAFASASRAIRAGERAGGIRALKIAASLDTGFASAHRLLGLTYRDAADRARARDALDHANANLTRLPFYERNQLVASQAMSGGAGYAAAIDAYNRILSRDPGDARALTGLGLVHAARREYAVQESLLVRALAVDSDAPSLHTGLAMAAVNQGKYDDARRVLEQAEQSFPGLRGIQVARISLAASQQDWDAAEREAREVVTRSQKDSGDALDGLVTLGSILMAQGQLSDAEQSFRRAISLGAARRANRPSFAAALSLAYLELRYRHSPSSAVGVLNATLTRFPVPKADGEDWPYDDVARFLADAGQAKRAADVMALGVKARGARSNDASRRWAAGSIATAERRGWEGEIEIQGASETHPCPICVLPDLARAYQVAGKPDSAIATYERYVSAPWQRRFETDAVELGFAMKRLGELYQQQNERSKAAAQYTALLKLWRGADAELQPLLADVRRRLEKTDDAVTTR